MSLAMKLMHPLFAEVGESDAGGAAAPAVDRGDALPDPAADEAAAAADAAAAAELDEKTDPDALLPRDKGGKFATKDAATDDARIPKERFDEAVGKERAAKEAAEARAVAAEARVQLEERSETLSRMEAAVDAMEEKYSKLMLDGESEQAAELRKDIRAADRAIARAEASAQTSQATSQAVEAVRMDSVIASLEAAHDVFNPASESFDKDLVDIVLAEQSRLMRVDKLAGSAALAAAADKIMKKMAPVAADAAGAKGLAAAAKTVDRKAEQVTKNLAVEKAQPGSMKLSGKDSDKAGELLPNPGTLTSEEFAALPESTRSKMRGDTL